MKIQILPDIEASIIEHTTNLSKPTYWKLLTGDCLIDPHQYQKANKTFGSKWLPGAGTPDGMLFDSETGNLLMCEFGVWRIGTELTLPEDWLVTDVIIGVLNMSVPIDFELAFVENYWLDSRGKWISRFEYSALNNHSKKFRLKIAEDFFLLFADDDLCGWLLHDPIRYLMSNDSRNFVGDSTEMATLLGQFYQLTNDKALDKILDEDLEIYQQLQNLKDSLLKQENHRDQALILIEEIEAIIENFYE